MENYKSRKKWGKGDQEVQLPIDAPAVKEEIHPQYEEYLLLLQEKNRLIKKLKRKNSRDIDLERKEQGFALYVNGANSDRDQPVSSQGRALSPPKSSRHSKTAGETRKNIYLNAHDLAAIETDEQRRQAEKKRAKTAPDQPRRKGWSVDSINIRTSCGEKRKLRAPEMLTGKYEDDFEPDDSEDFENPGDEQYQMSQHMKEVVDGSDSDGDIEIDARNLNRNSSNRPLSSSSRKTSYLKRKAAEIRKEEENDRLTLTISDVKKLRQSLEMNASIRRSLAMEVSSIPVNHQISEEEENVEVIFKQKEEEEDYKRESPIEEEDEEIEEDLVPAMDSMCLEGGSKYPKKNLLKPNDTIVLEFAPSSGRGKLERNLLAARKKDVEAEGVLKTPRNIGSPRPLPSPTRSKTLSSQNLELQAVTPSKKSTRPLSANRKSQGNNMDSREEASAVVRALQAENEKAQKFTKESKSSPRPQALQSSGTPQSSRASTPSRNSISKSAMSTSTNGLTDDKLSHILNKVLVMPPKQQRRLVKMLGKLEETSSSHAGTGSSHQSSKRPVKATVPVSEMQSNKQKSQFASSDTLEVNIEILSNWGHPDRVGLTEIQFFDQDKQIIPVKTSDVSVHGATGCKTSLETLFNGKTKTNKERYMWTCDFEEGVSVEFVINLMNIYPNKPFELSSIKLWNFNKSINDLNIGARHVRIFVGGELVFDGDVDKGCGNQVFDHSKVIDLKHSGKDNCAVISPTKGSSLSGSPTTNGHQKHAFHGNSRSPQSSASSSGSHQSSRPPSAKDKEGKGYVRSETRTLVHPNEEIRRPSVGSDRSQSSPEDEYSQDGLNMPQKGLTKTPKKSKRLAARLDGHSSETDTSKSVTDSAERKPPVASSRKSEDKSTHKSTEKFSSKVESTKTHLTAPDDATGGRGPSSPRKIPPIQQPEDHEDESLLKKLKEINTKEVKRKRDVPTWLKPEDLADKFESPPESREGSRADSRPNSRLSQHSSDSRGKSRADQLNTVIDGETGSPQAKSKGESRDEVTPMQRIQKNRSKWRSSHENLEEEWGSLSYFNQQHRGRLSIDMGDDALDEYLSAAKKPVVPDLTIPEEGQSDDDDGFVIPELPYGKDLVICIKTTWGDRHYVGITGVEIFSSSGEQVHIKKITAKPLDINELPGYHKDPRVVSNVIDGVNRTRDDVHMWLAPFTPGGEHFIFMMFDKPCKIAMIRVWNYNKSRIHSYRGAKDVVITLDKKEIFKGEIARASGGIEGGTEAFGDTILFTMDEDILELVSKNDEAFEGEMLSDDEEDVPFERPSTADNDERPFTRAAGIPKKVPQEAPRPGTSIVTYEGDVLVYKTRQLELNFTSTWGDMHYMGLTGLEVVGKDGEALPVNMKMITAKPRDLHSLPGHERDDRTLDKLINGINLNISDENMWLIPFTEGQNHTVKIDFGQQVLVSGLRIWNYNKSSEDTYRGARIVHIKIDGRQVSPSEGFLVRKGPGNCHFDFAQEISFSASHTPQNSYPYKSDNMSGDSGLEYEVVQMPCGFIYQLQLFSTWGDPYYVGLNGIEFYDSCFNRIQLTDNNISAYPDSVNVLDNIQNDLRTPDKLIDGINESADGKHMWLAPILPGHLNRVYVIFDQPTSVSMIKIWNYSKTPQRGVKDFALLVDDLLVYNGNLQNVRQGARGILPNCEGPQQHHTVLFTDNKEILKREKHAVISNQAQEQDVQLLNDKKIVTKYADPKNAQSGKPVNQALRPKTSVTSKRR